MTINREILEQYLDNALSTAQIAELEQALRLDVSAAALLKRLRQERALRVAAFKTYEPSAEESRQLATGWLEEFRHQPLATIEKKTWVWSGAKAAAVVLIAAGSFFAGQATKKTEIPATQPWQVIVQQSNGETSTKEFTNLEEAQNYAAQMASSTAHVDEGGVL